MGYSKSKTSKPVSAVICGLLITLLLIASCTSKNPEDKGGTIKLGAIFMLSGVGSTWGINSQRGAQMAVEEINKDGGVLGKRIEIVFEDNKTDDPALAVTSLLKLIGEGIDIFLGPNWSGSGQAVAPVACENKVLMVSPSLGVADFNEKCDSLFNLWPHDTMLSEALGKSLYNEGKRSIAILGSQDVWEKEQAVAVKRGFEKSGGSVVSFQLLDKDARDVATEALKIKISNPDAIVFTDYLSEDVAAKRLKELGVQSPLFLVLIDEGRVKAADGGLEGATVITSFTPSEQFVERFTKRYNEPPDIPADSSYDSVTLISKAIKETGSTDPIRLKEYLASIPSYRGMSGNLVFDGKRGVTKEPRFMKIKNGKAVPLIMLDKSA